MTITMKTWDHGSVHFPKAVLWKGNHQQKNPIISEEEIYHLIVQAMMASMMWVWTIMNLWVAITPCLEEQTVITCKSRLQTLEGCHLEGNIKIMNRKLISVSFISIQAKFLQYLFTRWWLQHCNSISNLIVINYKPYLIYTKLLKWIIFISISFLSSSQNKPCTSKHPPP